MSEIYREGYRAGLCAARAVVEEKHTQIVAELNRLAGGAVSYDPATNRGIQLILSKLEVQERCYADVLVTLSALEAAPT